MKYILAGIDGTGSRTWMETSGGSAVRRFVTDFDPQGGAKRFFHGPDNQATGSDSEVILAHVLAFIYEAYHAATGLQLPWGGPTDLPAGQRGRAIRETLQTHADRVVKVVLVGHSRGGLIAILAARRLQAPVAFLGLFDAVDRVWGLDGSTIQNVGVTYHALRHPGIESRPTFGNTGRASTGRYVERYFRTSHGGIGGAVETSPSGAFADHSCSIHFELLELMRTGGPNLAVLTSPAGARASLCAAEARTAEEWMRDNARRHGLPFRGR